MAWAKDGAMRDVPAGRGARWIGLAAAIVALDLASKAWVSSIFRYGEVREVTPFFNVVLVHNTGAAFSFLADAGGWQRWFFTAIAAVISVVLLVLLRRQESTWVAAAMAFVLGGAVGNLCDRVYLGHVVDFIQVHAAGHYFPAFNVADSAITVGVILLLVDSVRPKAPLGARTAGEEKA
jgi:signal peptidase II